MSEARFTKLTVGVILKTEQQLSQLSCTNQDHTLFYFILFIFLGGGIYQLLIHLQIKHIVYFYIIFGDFLFYDHWNCFSLGAAAQCFQTHFMLQMWNTHQHIQDLVLLTVEFQFFTWWSNTLKMSEKQVH